MRSNEEEKTERNACEACGTRLWAKLMFRVFDGHLVGACDVCSVLPYQGAFQPDVYLGSGGLKKDEHLCNPSAPERNYYRFMGSNGKEITGEATGPAMGGKIKVKYEHEGRKTFAYIDTKDATHVGRRAPEFARPIPFHTKRDKALAMKIANVRQADSAERQHGARNEEGTRRRTYFFT